MRSRRSARVRIRSLRRSRRSLLTSSLSRHSWADAGLVVAQITGADAAIARTAAATIGIRVIALSSQIVLRTRSEDRTLLWRRRATDVETILETYPCSAGMAAHLVYSCAAV